MDRLVALIPIVEALIICVFLLLGVKLHVRLQQKENQPRWAKTTNQILATLRKSTKEALFVIIIAAVCVCVIWLVGWARLFVARHWLTLAITSAIVAALWIGGQQLVKQYDKITENGE